MTPTTFDNRSCIASSSSCCPIGAAVTSVSAGIRSGWSLVPPELDWPREWKERITVPETANCNVVPKKVGELRFGAGLGRECETSGPFTPHHTHSTALSNDSATRGPISVKKR
jgi:hypothetical protein